MDCPKKEYTKKDNDRKSDTLATEEIKCVYKPDQWSPWNPEGKKKYDRRFLSRLRFHPLSLKKPESLNDRDDIKEIVLKECLREQKCSLCVAGSLKGSKSKKFSDSKNPEMNNAETVILEVAFGMTPSNILFDTYKEVFNNDNTYNVIVSQILLARITVVDAEKKIPAVTSESSYDHRTPQNTNGRIKYERDFLLKRHSHPLSLKKPEDLCFMEIKVEKDPFKHSHCHVCALEDSFIPVSVFAKAKVDDPKLLLILR